MLIINEHRSKPNFKPNFFLIPKYMSSLEESISTLNGHTTQQLSTITFQTISTMNALQTQQIFGLTNTLLVSSLKIKEHSDRMLRNLYK